MKKTISIIIALVFAFAFCTTAFAEDTTAAATTAIATTATESTTLEATTAITTLPETTTVTETSQVVETTVVEEPSLDEPVAIEDSIPEDQITLYKEIISADTVNEELMYASGLPQTGSTTGGIAIFATLSIAAAAAFVCGKRKA
ncbi:MAG: LPXTG cell wall anchor domain-containing protein [Eubacteriales bacterium]